MTRKRIVQTGSKTDRHFKSINMFHVIYHLTTLCFNDKKYASKSQHHINYEHYIQNMQFLGNKYCNMYKYI
jgi:hypothetical protein